MILPTDQLRCVALLCLAGVLTASCAVPIRYAVPSEELYGREVIGKTLDFVDGDDIDKFRVVAVESNVLPRLDAGNPKADEELQAALPGLRGEELILETDDSRIWPSLVGALVVGQVGMLAGDIYALSSSFGQNGGAVGDNILVYGGLGTLVGALVGMVGGALLAERIKPRHLAPVALGSSQPQQPFGAVQAAAMSTQTTQ